MTAVLPAPQAPQAPSAAPGPRPGLRGWLGRHRSAVAIGVALVAATAVAVIGGSGDRYSADLDPENASPGGGRAVARVLEDQGIDVEVVRDADAFAGARVDARTTVLITSTTDLGSRTAAEVLDRTGATEVVVVAPPLGVAEYFGAEDGSSVRGTRTIDAGCADPRFAGLRLETRSGLLFAPTAGACFPDEEGAVITSPADGVTLLGAADLLSNEQVTRADNAAVALRLLGERDHLLWYVPDPGDRTGEDGVGIVSLLPRWLGPGLLLVCLAVLALMTWRGRRFGPLAVEPLPVVVTAIETTRSRGRLYRKVDDRGYAAGALRQHARTEITEHLLGRGATPDVGLLVQLVGPHTSRDAAELRALLDPEGPTPRTDRDLITLANDLAALSREVRRP